MIIEDKVKILTEIKKCHLCRMAILSNEGLTCSSHEFLLDVIISTYKKDNDSIIEEPGELINSFNNPILLIISLMSWFSFTISFLLLLVIYYD